MRAAALFLAVAAVASASETYPEDPVVPSISAPADPATGTCTSTTTHTKTVTVTSCAAEVSSAAPVLPSEPAVSEPAVSEPAVSEPAVSEPAVSEPASSTEDASPTGEPEESLAPPESTSTELPTAGAAGVSVQAGLLAGAAVLAFFGLY